jgi:ribonuclease P protein component
VAAPSFAHVAPRAAHVLPSKERFGFSGERRLRQRVQFDAVMVGKGLPNKCFVIYQRANEVGVSRLGIVASKRVMPTAVARNLAKRTVREAFRQLFPVECALDVVVRVRRPVRREAMAECREALTQLFQAVQA